MVSIVIPVYNAEKYIAETIKSVLAQTYTDWELILVDDGSADESVARIAEVLLVVPDKVRGRIQVIRKEKNEGAAAARNAGLYLAKGRYLAFLDGDDLWLPDKLAKQLAFMEKTGAAFSFTGYEFGDENAAPSGKVVHVPPTLDYRGALSRTVISTITVLFDVSVLGKELLEMPSIKSEDTATWWRILRNGHTAHGLDEVTAIYRRYPRSLSADKLEAVRRIWRLYRHQEGLGLCYSLWNLAFWAVRATLRRI
ncbi:MAG: glycosyltransferase [Lachnospiraceae bacterium]|jgi:teichuronic acid biosynthesis glycosyltransferase TuaG|nr:glycosyltransferase [Lachnospiraceae bacterium]